MKFESYQEKLEPDPAEPYDPRLVEINIAEAISRSAFHNLAKVEGLQQTKPVSEPVERPAADHRGAGNTMLRIASSPLAVYNNH